MAAAVAFVLHARAWSFLCDDAFITFRYAENLGTHGVPVFNVGADPPEIVEGYTNFAWMVLLAAGSAMGVRPHAWAPVLTSLASLAGLVAAVLLLRGLRGDPPRGRLRAVDLLPVALLVASPEYMVWSGSGLETALAATLGLASMAAWVHRRMVSAAGLAAAAGLTRLDALLPVAAFGVAWVMVVGGPLAFRERVAALARVRWRRVGAAAVLFAGPLVAHALWRRAYYGTWLPNTWAVKAHGVLLQGTYGQAYIRSWVEHVHLVWLAPLGLALRPRHALFIVPIAGVVGYGGWVGGDFMAYSRFYVVATALLAVGVGWVVSDLAAAARRRGRPGASGWAVGLVVVLAALLGREARSRYLVDLQHGERWLQGMWEGVVAMDRFAKVGLAAGTWMREHLPPQTWITVGAAGAVPYGSGLRAIDAYGLVDPKVASLPAAGPYVGSRVRPGHQMRAPAAYIRARDPDLLCHVGFRGRRPPPAGRYPRGFGRGYAWACIDLPAIADRRAQGGELPAGVYCCRRPRDRSVGPFGGEP